MLSYSLYEKNNKNFNIYFNDNTAISNQNEILQQNNILNIQNITSLFTLINTQQKIITQLCTTLVSELFNNQLNNINNLSSIDQTNFVNNQNYIIFFIKLKLKMLGVDNANKIDEIIKRLSPSQASEFLNELERLFDILSSNDLEKNYILK
jgi:hypothetical protein